MICLAGLQMQFHAVFGMWLFFSLKRLHEHERLNQKHVSLLCMSSYS